jgi:hypothetical protein
VQVVGLDFNTITTIGFTSDLESGELNLRHRCGLMCGPLETSTVYGLRYVRVDESFSYASQSLLPPLLGSTNRVDVRTNNDLFGFTAGILSAYRVSDRWWFEFDVKGTLAANNSEQETIYTAQNPISPGTFAFSGQAACTAFIGDINLVSHYQVTHYMTVRAGYQAIWVDGVAVALENFSPDIPVLTQGPAEVNDNGTLVFHGPHLGLLFAW